MIAALDLISRLRLPDQRPFGEAMADFQRHDFEAMLAPDGPPNVWVSRPRGGSKTTDVAALAIVDLLHAPDRSTSFAVAADADQARLLRHAIEGWCIATPELHGSFDLQRDLVVNTETGASLRVLASDAPSALGLTPWRLYCDELAAWPSSGMWESMYSASPKAMGQRVFILTTAGSPASWAFNLWKSVQDSPRWQVLHTTELPPWVDLAAVEDARLQLPEGIAERFFANRWVVADEAPFTVEQIEAITMTEPPPKARNAVHFLGCDFGLTNDAACIAVVRQARSDQDEPHVLVKLWHRQGSRENPVPLAEFEDTIERLRRDLYPTYVYADPWQLVATIQRLGIEPFNFTSQGKTLISSSLTRLIRERRLLIPPDPGLRSELLNLTIRESSRGWGLEAATGHDDRAMALAIAAHHADLHPRGTERWRYAM